MTRIAPQLAGVTFAVLVGALMVDNPALGVGLVAPTLALTYWTWRVRRHEPAERPWSAPPATMSTTASSSTAAGRPPARRVVTALGWVEARQLALSPWFGIGVGLCVVMVTSFASDYERDQTWSEIVPDLPFLAHPLVGMVVLASHRARTRAARDGAAELFGSCPTMPVTRTWGALAAAPVPMVALAVFSAAYLAVVKFSSGVGGAFGSATIPTVLGAIVLGGGGVALGIALGGRVQSPLAPVATVIAIGFASPALASGQPGELSARMLLSTMPSVSDQAPVLTWGQAWIHVAWLAAVSAAAALGAVAGRPRDRTDSAGSALPEPGTAPAGATTCP